MNEVDERRLKEPFLLQREQCGILLEGMEQVCKDLKSYKDDLELEVLDDEMKEKINDLTYDIASKEVNLRNVLDCIESSLGEMQEAFSNFPFNEELEAYYPTYEIRLKDQIKTMNISDITKREIDHHQRYLNVKELIGHLGRAANGDEDFAEISGDSQLDRIPIDPFTQQEIDIPVRNKICRHVYDKNGITNYINQRARQNKQAKCPTIGCQNELTFNDLVEDLELKEKIDRLKHMET